MAFVAYLYVLGHNPKDYIYTKVRPEHQTTNVFKKDNEGWINILAMADVLTVSQNTQTKST